MSITALLSLSTTILSSQEHTVDCSVADNDVYTVGETVCGITEKDLVSKIHNKRPESLCRLKVNLFDDFTT